MQTYRKIVGYLLAAVACAAAPTVFAQGANQDIEAWREQYEKNLRAEYGWLSVVGLSFLDPGVNTVGSLAGSDVPLPPGHAPLEVGRLVYTDRGVTLHLRAGIEATLNGKDAPAIVTLGKAVPGTPADRVRVGRVEFHLHESGDRLAVRVRDPDSALRVGFEGTKWYAPRATARVTGTLQPSATPRDVSIINVLGDVEMHKSPGTLSFVIDGSPQRVVPMAASRNRLWIIFRDATVGTETYGTRYLYAEPSADGTYVLDFNRAYNPPCAYNPYTTCPTPPPENILPIPIRAGEKLYTGTSRRTSR